MKKTNQDNNFKCSIHSYKEVLNEYYVLAQRPLLSELEAKRVEHILEMACQDEKLSLLLHEIDEAIFQEQNLDGAKDTHENQNQIARVLELIDGEIPSHKIIFEHAKLNLATYEKTIGDYYRLLKLSSLSEANEAHMEHILEEAYNDELLSLLLEIVDEKFFERSSVTQPDREDIRKLLVDKQSKVSFQPKLISNLSEQSRSSKIKTIGSKIRHHKSSLLNNVKSGLIACSLMLSAPCLIKLIYDVFMMPLTIQMSASENLPDVSLMPTSVDELDRLRVSKENKIEEFKPEIDLGDIDLPYIDFGGSDNSPNTNIENDDNDLESMAYEMAYEALDKSLHAGIINQGYDDFFTEEEVIIEFSDEQIHTLIDDVDLDIAFNSSIGDRIPVLNNHSDINNINIDTALRPFATQGYVGNETAQSSNSIHINAISGSSNNSETSVNQLSQLVANTVISGNRGDVIIRSGEGLHFSPWLTHGGANRGNGSVIEVSDDNLTAKVGNQGTILLAPFNIVIGSFMETEPDEIGQLDDLSNSGDILIGGEHGNISIDTQKNSAPIAVEVVSAESISLSPIEQINNYSQGSLQSALVTSVSELSDVRPSDWAFTALQHLVEEYGCIEGFPNRTYRGNQSMTRYEFAAGLNACLDVVVQLIGSSITTEELDTIRRLQEEFQSELVTLRGRVEALEADVAELDAHVNMPLGEEAFDDESTTFEYRARLNFDTSFTGEDRLRIRLQTGDNNDAPAGFPGGFANSDSGGNDATLNDVFYAFPIVDHLDVIIAGNSILTDDFVTSTIVPFDGPNVVDASGPLLYDFEMDGDVEVGFSFAFTENLVLDVDYSVESDAVGNPDSQGIFSGSGQSYIAQISYLSEGMIDAGFAFLHGNPEPDSEATNTFAGLLNLDFGRFEVGGFGAFHDQAGTDEESFSWVAGVTLPDFFLEGNTLGIYVGQAPSFDDDEPFYAEGFYDIEVNEFLTITPAVLWAEENDFHVNDDVDRPSVYGVVRATFRF